MSVPLGLARLHPSAAAARPHYLGFSTARTVADDSLFELWNGSTSAARVLRVNKDGQVQAANGTVLLPAYSFESDKDSGIYRIGANNIGVAVNAAKVLDIGTAGLGVTGTLTTSGALLLTANDGAAIGASGTAWSDLFLASGAVINWNAGNVTITHAANLLTLAGGGLALTGVVGVDYNPGSDIDADIITVGVTGTPRLYWVEASDRFAFTHGITVGASGGNIVSDGAGGVYLRNSTGETCVNIGAAAGGGVGFYSTAAIAKQTGVAVTAGGIHAALVALGLIGA